LYYGYCCRLCDKARVDWGWFTYDLSKKEIIELKKVMEIQTSGDSSTDDIAVLINKNLDIILTDYKSDEQKNIDAHPNEFAEIIALGEAALPYLNDIVKKFNDYYFSKDYYNTYRCVMAMKAAYTSKPELYDIDYPSPDGKYILKAGIYSFLDYIYNSTVQLEKNISIIDCETGNVLFLSNMIYTNLSVGWSLDSRYAIISSGHFRYFTEISI
jgi:hypothetical protein